MSISRLRTLFSFIVILSTLTMFSCSQGEKVKPEDPRIARIAAINREIALGKAARTNNTSTWTARPPLVGVWGDNAGIETTGNSAIRIDLDNGAGDGLEVQMVYNGSDNGQLVFQDWTNVGINGNPHYYEPSAWGGGGWRDIYFDIPAAILNNTSDVYVTLRWRSFTKSNGVETSSSDWSYFTRHWYHGNKGY